MCIRDSRRAGYWIRAYLWLFHLFRRRRG